MGLVLVTLLALALGGGWLIRRLEKRLARVRPQVSRDWLNDYWYRSER